MPPFPIVDTHVHVWDPGHLHYPWLEAIELLNKPHLLGEYRAACGPVEVEKMVFVQAEVDFAQYQAEAEWVAGLAGGDPRLQGIVAWAPLEEGDAARPALERLAGTPLVKGVRRIIQFEPDLEFCLRPDFVTGVQALPDYSLTFDICIAHVHLANTLRLVEQCPEVTFILDHIGKPDIAARHLEPWKTELRQLAGFANVWCKMSGLVTEADHDSWEAGDLQPYIDHVLDCFGFGRVMYGGDWPVASQATEYPRWVETLERAVQGCSEAELRQLFRDNAIAFYRLGD